MTTATVVRSDPSEMIRAAHADIELRRINTLTIDLTTSRAAVVLRSLLQNEPPAEDMDRLAELASMLRKGIPTNFYSGRGNSVLVATVRKAWLDQSQWLSEEEREEALPDRLASYRRAATALQAIANGRRPRRSSLRVLLHMVTNLQRAARAS